MTAASATISDEQWAELLRKRALDPGAVVKAFANRKRRAQLTAPDGTLFLVAADHPARGSLASGGDPLAMANRRRLIQGLVTSLAHPEVDGVLGSPDILEELLLLGALEDKVIIGSMNRGGLDGARWGMDDRFTGYDAAAIERLGLDGGKVLLRLDNDDAGTAPTLENVAGAVSELADARLMALVEPLPQTYDGHGKRILDRSDAALARAVTIASGLGTSSAYTWLKLPAAHDPELVYSATTLPCVVLGGVPDADPQSDLNAWARALERPEVRGLVVGRALLYPADGDVATAVDAAARVLRP